MRQHPTARLFSIMLLTVVVGFLPDSGIAQEKTELVFSDPETAISEDPDFALQGEYTGLISSDSGENKLGVQIIALGEGKFQAVGYLGGLPGDGWNGEQPERIESELQDEKVVFDGEFARVILTSDGLSIHENEGGAKLGVLARIERKSETLGLEPPEGAFIFFDGTSADKFTSPDGGAATMEQGLLVQGANSKHRFGDCHLHIEFRLPYQPTARGQGRGNSGIYLQGRYEVQMLDSFGLTGEQNECGGIYGIRKPDLNMCFPPLSWQTYDIDFRAARFDANGDKLENARMTVKHNGVLIHDDVELPKTTTAAPLKESSEDGFLHLQNHRNPVRYRNIWMVEK